MFRSAIVSSCVTVMSLLMLPSALAATFSFGLSGPTSFAAGQTATYDVTVDYIPRDLTPGPGSLMAQGFGYEYLANVSLLFGFSVTDSVNDAWQGEVVSYLWGHGNADSSWSQDFDPGQAFSTTFSFEVTIPEAGNYTVNYGGSWYETINRLPTSACTLSAGCDPQVVADYSNYSGSDSRSQALQVSAVPEPETYAMLLAGVAIAGVISLRRQKP